MKVSNGDIKNLKDISAYNLEFDYSNVTIPKFDAEEEYVSKKVTEMNADEAGTGDRFKKAWYADRKEKYEPKFIESFNKRFDNGEVKVDYNLDAAYTIKVTTTFIERGYNVGVWRKDASIEATITVYKKDNPSEIIWSADFTKVPGAGAMGYDFEAGLRISEAYAKLAKEFAAKINKVK